MTTTREQRRQRKALNQKAYAVVVAEQSNIQQTIPLDAYRDEKTDHLPEELISGHVLRRRRGDLTDAAAIARVCELVARGVSLSKARDHVGVPRTIWGDWARANHCGLGSMLEFARLVRLDTMRDELLEIADDPELLATPDRDEHGNPLEATISEKVKVAEFRVRTRQWILEKLAKEFTPKQVQQIQSISAQVNIDLTPEQAMQEYQKLVELRS